MTAINELADISTTDLSCLHRVGIRTAEQLLELGSTASARQHLADTCSLDDEYITYLVHVADLMRIQYVGPSTAQLLCTHGVTTCAKLAYRNAHELHKLLAGSNETNVPSEDQLEKMIASAKLLTKAVYH